MPHAVKQMFEELGRIETEQTLSVESLPAALELPLAGSSLRRPHQCTVRRVHLDGVSITVLAVSQDNAVHLYGIEYDGKEVVATRIAGRQAPNGDPTPEGSAGGGDGGVSDEEALAQHAAPVEHVGLGSWVEFVDDETDNSHTSDSVAGGVRTWGVVSLGRDHAVCLWNVVDGKLLECMGGQDAADDEDVHTAPVTAGCYIPYRSPAGAVRAAYWTAGEDNTMRAWSLMDGYQTRDMRITVPGVPTCMGCIEVLHPLEEANGVEGGGEPAKLTIVATGMSTGRVEMRNFAEASVHCTLNDGVLPSAVRSIVGVWWARQDMTAEEAATPRGGAFVCDRGLAFVCDECHDIFVYKPSTEHMVCTLGGHECPVVGLCMVYPPSPAVSEEGQMWGCDLASPATAQQSRLASLDSSGQVRLWDLATGACERAAQLVCKSDSQFVGLAGAALAGGDFLLAASTSDSVTLVTLR